VMKPVSKTKDEGGLGTEAGVRNPEEVDLVCRAKAQDSAAFGELVRRYQRRAVSVAFRLVGNSADASDVSQEAFVRAYRNLNQLEDAARFGPWLMRVVSNLSLNFRRSRASRPASSLDDTFLDGADFRRPGAGLRLASSEADEPTRAGELEKAMDAALEQLPDQQRLALILFSVEGMPQKDVAEILECSVELVKWNVFQARKKLKELLSTYL
jgi:RNA polymerase sigma-70 factor (ECF subfamily)